MTNQTIDIQIPNIEKELNQQSRDQNKKTNRKACLFTLIIYASNSKRINYLQDLINSILDKFPCRIIFIQGEKESETSYFRVKVSSVNSGQPSSSVRCDQIVIEASQDQLFRTPFLVIPHIVPDLPLYLLWGQNPFEERDIFPYFQCYAQRVIFDSECADNLKLFCNEMLTNLDTLKMDVMDINWALFSNWRDVFVEIFDTPEKLKQLNSSKSIIISYNDLKISTSQHPEIRALYLQGWLASALKWNYQTTEYFENNVVMSYFGNIHPVVIALTSQTKLNLPPGAIISIEITTSTNHSYLIYRKDDLPQVDVHVCSNQTCELPFSLSLPNIHKGLSFMREIFFGNLGEHYRKTLKKISTLDFK